MPIAPGLRAGFSHTVTEADTALAAGSGDVPVLATPKVLALVERASVEAVAGALHPGATTVGARVELEHLRATPVGATVAVEAVLERVDGRRLEFAVRVSEGERLAASGWVIRVVVDRAGFVRHAGAG
jgi:predicted thioesterase